MVGAVSEFIWSYFEDISPRILLTFNFYILSIIERKPSLWSQIRRWPITYPCKFHLWSRLKIMSIYVLSKVIPYRTNRTNREFISSSNLYPLTEKISWSAQKSNPNNIFLCAQLITHLFIRNSKVLFYLLQKKPYSRNKIRRHHPIFILVSVFRQNLFFPPLHQSFQGQLN